MTHQSLVEKLDSNIMGLIFVRTFAITPPPHLINYQTEESHPFTINTNTNKVNKYELMF